MLNRDPVPLQSKFTDELFETGGLRKRIEGTRLTIENKSKGHNPSSLAGDLTTPHYRIIRHSPGALPPTFPRPVRTTKQPVRSTNPQSGGPTFGVRQSRRTRSG